MVIVPKPDGSVRICSDYKVSINKVVEDTPYPLLNNNTNSMINAK